MPMITLKRKQNCISVAADIVIQVLPLGQGNNSYGQVSYCTETVCVLMLIHHDVSDLMEVPSSITTFCSHVAYFGQAFLSYRLSCRMMPDNLISRNNFNIIPLELKLLDYGHKTNYHLEHTVKSST